MSDCSRKTGPKVVVYGVNHIPGLVKALKEKLVPLAAPHFPADEAQAVEMSRDAKILITRGGAFFKPMFLAARSLDWVHSTSAGVNGFMFPEFVESPVILTNSRGCYGQVISNHVFAFVLALLRNLPLTLEQQKRREWRRVPAQQIEGKTMSILGFGGIGRAVAARARTLQMTVLAGDICEPTGSAAALHDGFYDCSNGIPSEFASRADFLVSCCPLTPKTRHIIGAQTLSQMKKSAFIINVSRGEIIDQKALADSLKRGEIAGAALDVFEKEPLPAEDPLWGLDNVIITPHMAWISEQIHAPLAELAESNVQRYVEGKPLLNVVDKSLGY